MPQNESSVGPVIATIIILAVIVLGGLYFWGQRGDNNGTAPQTPTTSSADLNAINSQSSSDDTSSIQTDLQNTNTENLDSQLNAS
jgi:hypothetical protein